MREPRDRLTRRPGSTFFLRKSRQYEDAKVDAPSRAVRKARDHSSSSFVLLGPEVFELGGAGHEGLPQVDAQETRFPHRSVDLVTNGLHASPCRGVLRVKLDQIAVLPEVA